MNAVSRRILIGGILSLLLAQILFGALMLSALYKQYQEPIFQINGLLCQDIANHLGLLERAGKSLRAATVERFLSHYRSRTEAENIAVASPSGHIIYQWKKDGPSSLLPPADAKSISGQLKKFSSDDSFLTTCPITGKNGAVTGYVFIALDKERISRLIFTAAQKQLLLFLAITAGECLLLAVLLRFLSRKAANSPEASPSALRLRMCFMIPLIAGQCLFLLLLSSPLSHLYQSELAHTGMQLNRQLAWDLERLAGMGLPVHAVHGLESWMTERQKHTPTRGMAIFDITGKLHAAASAKAPLSAEEWQRICESDQPVTLDLRHPADGTPAGKIQIVMDSAKVGSNLRSVMLDNLTMTIVAALFLSELLFLLLMRPHENTPVSQQPEFMRPLIFACLFSTEMSMSYVPIRIGELGFDLFGLPPDIVSGLPVSSELFMAAAAMFAGGFWSQRSGWKPMLLSGVALSCAGSWASFLSPSPLLFILARCLSGLGYGFINLAAQVFVIAHSSESGRSRNLAFMFAGLYAGTLCGSSMGGLIADRMGYHAVFPASAIMLVFMVLILLKFLPHEPWQSQENTSSHLTLSEAADFLFDRRMGSLLLFFIIPNALITVCLFQFFVPLSLNHAGYSPATIGRIFLLYCIIVMFAGPAVGSLLDKTSNKERPLFLSMLMAAASVASLLVFNGIAAAVASIVLLAFSTSIAANGQGPYALTLPASQKFGRARTIGFYNVAMRIGQVLGPLSLGIMMAVWNASSGLTVLAAGSACCALLFAAFSKTAREKRN